MKYDFDELIERRGSGSYKWDGTDREDILPLWVADMDFRVAEPILAALRKRVEHGIFGYTKVPDTYYQAISGWFERRHGWKIERDEVIYTSGVVPAISAIIKAFTGPGDKVLIQTPVYNCFFSSIRNNGCTFERFCRFRHILLFHRLCRPRGQSLRPGSKAYADMQSP